MIILEGSPISTQHLYKNHGHIRFMTKEAKELKESYQWQAKTQWKKPIIKGDVRVEIKLFFKDKRRRDWDNWHKVSCDALTGIVWEDDCQIQEAKVTKHIDEKRPRIEIEVNG